VTSLRISVDSSDAVRGSRQAQEAIRNVGAQAQLSEAQVQGFTRDLNSALTFGSRRAPLGADPLGIKAAVKSAEEALASLNLAQFDRALEAGVASRFGGGGLGGLFSQAELGGTVAALRAARAEMTELGLQSVLTTQAGSAGLARMTVSAQALAASTAGAAERAADLFSLPRAVTPQDFDLRAQTSVDPRAAAILAAQERALGQVRGAFTQAGDAAEAYGASVTRSLPTGAFAAHTRAILTTAAAYVGLQTIGDAVRGLSSFEDALIQIRQTTGLSEQSVEALGQRIVALGSQIPVATSDLLALAATAGRLQIRTPEGIEQFVREAGTLRAIAPGIGGAIDDFGNKLGRLTQLAGESPQAIGRIGDVIARLEDNFAAPGDAILDTGIQIARAGSGFIDSTADALAFGAALSSLGSEGRQASGAFGQIISSVREALTQGGQALATLEQITGQNAAQLRESFRTDAAEAFIAVLDGVARSGAGADQVLTDLGLASAEETRALGPLIANTQILSRALTQARSAQLAGGDAAADLGDRFRSLGGQLQVTRNLVGGLLTGTDGLSSGLKSAAAVVNDILGDIAGLDDSTDGATRGVQALATGLEAAAIAGAGALIIGRLAALYQASVAPIVATTTAIGVYGEVTGVATVQTLGLAAAMTRARAASLAFLSSPAGIALAVGGAIAGLVALQGSLDDIDTTGARGEIDAFLKGLEGLDRAAQGLEDARDIELRATLTGDPELKIEALQRRLSELEVAANAVAGAVRGAGDGIATIPAPKLEALKIEELFPDLSAVRQLFGFAVEDAAKSARERAQEEFSKFRVDQLRINPSQFAGASLPPAEDFFPPRFRQDLIREVGSLFGPEAGRQAQAALDAVFQGVQIPGLSADASAQAAQSVKDALALVSTGEIDSAGLDVLVDALVGIGAVGPTATSALDALHGAIAQSREELEGLKAAGDGPPPTERLSDFYVEEAQRIREQIQSAQLSINSLTVSRRVGDEDRLFSLRGIEAHVQALEEDRIAFEALNAERVAAREISDREADALNDLAAEYQDVAIEVLEYQEALNLLGVQQDLLGRTQGILGQQLQRLGDTAQGETGFAFEIMRQQIDLATRAEELNIQAMVRAGQITPEVAASYLELSDAQRRMADDSVDLRERLTEQARAVAEIGDATGSFARAGADALLGLREPAEAFRDALSGVLANLLQARLQAGALGGLDALFGGDESAGPSVFRQAAEQGGTGDLFRGLRGDGPAPEGIDVGALLGPAEAQLQATLAGLAIPLQEVGATAGVASAGLGELSASTAVQGASQDAGTASIGSMAGAANAAAAALQALAGAASAGGAAGSAGVASAVLGGGAGAVGAGLGGAATGGAQGFSASALFTPGGRGRASSPAPSASEQTITIYNSFSGGSGPRGFENAMRYSPHQLERDLRDTARRRFR
jgi:hypothetical protein